MRAWFRKTGRETPKHAPAMRPMRHRWKRFAEGDVRCVRRGCRARKRMKWDGMQCYPTGPANRSCRNKTVVER